MQYRTYKLQALASPYTWAYTGSDGVSRSFCNYDTLVYASGGAVASQIIDNDYLLANNSTVNIARETKAVAGQIIALIDDSGAYDIGVISSVDNTKLQILYKSMLELFNGEILNPMRVATNTDEVIKYLYDGVEDTAQIIASFFAAVGTDKYRRLPIRIRTSGGGTSGSSYLVPAVWKYKDNAVNVRDWLIELFNTHNVVVQCSLVFEVGRAYIDLYVSHNTTGGRLIKNNVHGMTFTHAEDSAASATVCQIINQDTKAYISTWYLLSNNTVTTNANASTRVQPYKLIVAEFDPDNDDGATAQTVAEDNLLYSDFNHYISVVIDRNSSMYPKRLNIGDAVTVVPETEDVYDGDIISSSYADKVMPSIYTGRKENSENSQVTLIFGKIRINYTDLIQMRQLKLIRS